VSTYVPGHSVVSVEEVVMLNRKGAEGAKLTQRNATALLVKLTNKKGKSQVVCISLRLLCVLCAFAVKMFSTELLTPCSSLDNTSVDTKKRNLR
jgi:hypothetical protein